MKKLLAVIIAFALVFGMTCGLSEKTQEQLKEEFDELLDEYLRISKISEILENGYTTYPTISENYDNAFSVEFDLPDEIYSFTDGQPLTGTIYLATGTVVEKESGLIWIADVDGKLIRILAMSYIDGSSIKNGAKMPKLVKPRTSL